VKTTPFLKFAYSLYYEMKIPSSCFEPTFSTFLENFKFFLYFPDFSLFSYDFLKKEKAKARFVAFARSFPLPFCAFYSLSIHFA
jgi:hypothetical protein